MTQKIKDEERVRKAYSPRGQRGQKMLNFRCDLENWEYLQTVPNRGRYLNNLIHADRQKNC